MFLGGPLRLIAFAYEEDLSNDQSDDQSESAGQAAAAIASLDAVQKSRAGGLVLLGRRLAARGPVPRRHAAAEQAIRGARRQARPARSQIRRRARHGRPHAAAPGELRSRPRHAAEGRRGQRQEAALRRRRSARRPWPGHRRVQGAERDRRGLQGRPSLLLHRLPARARAWPDDRGHRARPRRPFSSASSRFTPKPTASRR